MQNKLRDTTLALAGMMQAMTLVKTLAQTGKADPEAFQACIYSLFETEPLDVVSIYQDISKLRVGLSTLVTTFNSSFRDAQSLMQYIMSLIHIEKKIRPVQSIQDKLKKRLIQAKKQADYFHLTHPTVIANLADTYLNIISTFRFRIIVWGNPRLLNTPEIMEKIRALLLAGLRSAVLWRQLGGSRFDLLFSRKKIKNLAESILATLPNERIAQDDLKEKEPL